MSVNNAASIEGLKHIFSAENVGALGRAASRKKALLDFFEAYYDKLGVKERLEPNELSIIADFHFFNFEFAKEQLLLPDDKAALLLNVLAMLFSFKHLDKSRREETKTAPALNEDACAGLLAQKFDSLKEVLLAFALDNPPASLKVFSPDEIQQTLDFASRSYFRHFSLFTFAANNPQQVANRSMTLYIDEPLAVPPLAEVMGDSQKEKARKEEAKVAFICLLFP